MASITIAPFRTVTVGDDTVAFPRLDDVEGLPWEPAATLRVVGDVAVDPEACRAAAGLPGDAPLNAALEVWCDETYWSGLTTTPAPPSTDTVTLTMTIPPGTVHGRLGIRRLLLLGADLESPGEGVASRRGSILATSTNASVPLSGDGGQFPTSPMDFAAAGLPKDARWSLSFRHETPDDPVLGTVTLWLNESSPAVRILRGQDEAETTTKALLGRELRRYVVEQLIRQAVADEQLDNNTDWPEHSVGHLLTGVVRQFTGQRSLDELRTMSVHERQRFEALLQAGVPDVII